jgi:hypothetical protein
MRRVIPVYATGLHHGFNTVRRGRDTLVFPDTYRDPASFLQAIVGVYVSRAIRLDFVAPPRGVRLRPCSVFGTAVPEAPIDKYRDPLPREHDVGSSPQPRYYRSFNAEPESSAMQLRSKSELVGGVAPAGRLHAPAYIRRRCGRRSQALSLPHDAPLASRLSLMASRRR